MGMNTTDHRRSSHPQSRVRRNQAACDLVSAAWALIESGYRTEDRAGVAANKRRAVEHLEAAIRAIKGGQ